MVMQSSTDQTELLARSLARSLTHPPLQSYTIIATATNCIFFSKSKSFNFKDYTHWPNSYL
jgi:hypothetical protein